MIKSVLTLLLMLGISQSFGQTIQQVDSVTVKMCETLSNLKNVKDDIQVTMIFQKHLPDFYDQLDITSQKKADSISDLVYYRLQKNCKAFTDILINLEPEKGDWASTPEKPATTVKKRQCDKMFKSEKFSYKESDGGIVNVVLANGIWEETFQDGTKSRLNFIQKNDCEFALSFIESDNEIRRNLSVKGDLYHYGISSYAEKKYALWIFSKEVYYTFILYEN